MRSKVFEVKETVTILRQNMIISTRCKYGLKATPHADRFVHNKQQQHDRTNTVEDADAPHKNRDQSKMSKNTQRLPFVCFDILGVLSKFQIVLFFFEFNAKIHSSPANVRTSMNYERTMSDWGGPSCVQKPHPAGLQQVTHICTWPGAPIRTTSRPSGHCASPSGNFEPARYNQNKCLFKYLHRFVGHIGHLDIV